MRDQLALSPAGARLGRKASHGFLYSSEVAAPFIALGPRPPPTAGCIRRGRQCGGELRMNCLVRQHPSDGGAVLVGVDELA